MGAPAAIEIGKLKVGDVSPQWRRAHAGSGLTSRLILAYVEREGGRQAVDRVLASAGLAERERWLRDENCWFGYETKLAIWQAAEEVLGDPDVAEHVGASALHFTVAMGLKRALRALGSPEFVYRNVVRANSKFNWAHELELLDKSSAHAQLRYTDVSGVGYHRYDCDYTRGLLATVPQLFGLPPARVTHPVCGARGGAACEFEVNWTTGLQGTKRAAVGLGLGVSALAVAGALAAPVLLPIAGGVLLAGSAAIGARALLFTSRRVRVLEERVREQDDAAERLLSSLGELSSNLRLDEVLEQIATKAQTAVGGKEFALLLADDDGLRAERHSGIPSASLAALESWAKGHRQGLREGTVVIDDLTTTPELAPLTCDPDLPLGSLCAAPLVFGEQLLGVLAALAHGSTVFLPGDAAVLSAYAAHAAIALSNARLVERLERQAAEDALTGLANQRAFERACAAEFSRAQREGGPVAIVALDLDHFKEINDTHGHLYGDEVLRGVAGALRGSVRPHDTVARLGGEEFSILLKGANSEVAYEIAERARAAIARVPVRGSTLSSSAGVASDSTPGVTRADLVALADNALYDAKRRGRGKTVVCARAADPAPASAPGARNGHVRER